MELLYGRLRWLRCGNLERFGEVAVERLRTDFASPEELSAYIRELVPWAVGEACSTEGGRLAAERALARVQPAAYARTRNFGDGQVTRLSAYIRHGVISLNEVRNRALERVPRAEEAEKLIQELAWRDYWQRVRAEHPQWMWSDIEPYKTGFDSAEYALEMPTDIVEGRTGVACLDYFIGELIATGYLHNHARMYLAAYVVHFRRVRWQAGAKWFLEHLLDGDLASNNLSWQWVASTFSNKPYVFNLENVMRYFGRTVDVRAESNRELDASYEELDARLFPRLGGMRGAR